MKGMDSDRCKACGHARARHWHADGKTWCWSCKGRTEKPCEKFVEPE